MTPGICGRNCGGCGFNVYCQGCSFCDMPFCGRDCEMCPSLCPRKEEAFSYLKNMEVGRLALRVNKKYALPAMIPVLPDHFTERVRLGQKIIGLHGGNFFTSNGENVARVYRKKGLRETLNLEGQVEGVLQFYVKDRTLEGFWDNRKEIYKQLGEFPLAAVIAPNFSVYEDAPRLDHLYNIKRSAVVYNELLDEGFNAVPDISWYDRTDLDRWIREIKENNLKTIAFSFQCVGTGNRASNAYIDNLTGFKYLVDQISGDVDLIIAGMASAKRVEVIKANCENAFSVLNQSAYVHSRRGVLSETGKGAGQALSMNQILKRNIAFYAGAYRR